MLRYFPSANPLVERQAVRELSNYIGKEVVLILTGGTVIRGRFIIFDDHMNVIMEDCHEIVKSPDGTTYESHMGTYLVRGDNIQCVGARVVEPDPIPEDAPDAEE